MAEIEQAIYSRLSGHTGLSALVGTRIYPTKAPQNPTFPLVTYQRVKGSREITMGTTLALFAPTIQVTAWDRSYSGAVTVGVQVRAALLDFSGTVSGVQIERVILDNEIDLDFQWASDVFGRASDWIVWHYQA